MENQRQSQTSSVLASRFKKYDKYQHRPQGSLREVRAATTQPIRHVVATMPSLALETPEQPRRAAETISYISVKEYDKPSFNKKPVLSQPKNHSLERFVSQQTTSPGTQSMALYAVSNSSHASLKHTFGMQFLGSGRPRIVEFLSEHIQKAVQSKLRSAFYMFGVSVFLFASVVSVQTLLTNKHAAVQVKVLGEQTQVADSEGVSEGTTSQPAETEVPQRAVQEYTVNPEMPRYLRIPALGVVARIKQTGVTKDGAVDAPKNINDVSWYNESARPGSSNGASLLLGHVSGKAAPGVFKKINQLKQGQRFEVEKGSGEKLTYEVTHTESVPLDQINMGKILSTDDQNQHELRLMTCSGKYNKEKHLYEERFVVYAKILR